MASDAQLSARIVAARTGLDAARDRLAELPTSIWGDLLAEVDQVLELAAAARLGQIEAELLRLAVDEALNTASRHATLPLAAEQTVTQLRYLRSALA